MSKKTLARQLRCWSMGMESEIVSGRSTTNWRPRKDAERDGKVSKTSKIDEATVGLFGNDPRGAWVKPPKVATHTGKLDSERKTLWEEALYTQQPNLMNDSTHILAEGIPEAVGGPDPMEHNKQDPYVNSRFIGMYPSSMSENPGQYWKHINSQTLYSHMLFEQSKSAETDRYGGEFGLPKDDFQTQNGVLPLLSAEKFRNLKYQIHEPIVRELNAITDGGKVSLLDILRLTLDEKKLSIASAHSAWCTFWGSIYPRGGVLRPEFNEIIERDFESVSGLEAAFTTQGTALYSNGGGTVWLVLNEATDKMEVISILSGPKHPYHMNYKIIAAMIITEDTVKGFDSSSEYIDRFLSVFDYDYAYASYCEAKGIMKPSSLVF